MMYMSYKPPQYGWPTIFLVLGAAVVAGFAAMSALNYWSTGSLL